CGTDGRRMVGDGTMCMSAVVRDVPICRQARAQEPEDRRDDRERGHISRELVVSHQPKRLERVVLIALEVKPRVPPAARVHGVGELARRLLCALEKEEE